MDVSRAQLAAMTMAAVGLLGDVSFTSKLSRRRVQSEAPITDEERERRQAERAEAWRRLNTPMYRCGRNQPCPCGSGKKFKLCCIDKRQGE